MVDWSAGPITVGLESDGEISFGVHRELVTPLGTFRFGGKSGVEPGEDEVKLVILHKSGAETVRSEYTISTRADVRIDLRGDTSIGLRGREVTVDATGADVREMRLTGVTWAMPDLVGKDLQQAENVLLQLSGGDSGYSSVYDATGLDRSIWFDGGWKVCTQSVDPGRGITVDNRIGLGVVGEDEVCPVRDVPLPLSWALPDFRDMPLDEATERLAEVTGGVVSEAVTHDMTGADRGVSFESNWKVCGQLPAPGSQIAAGIPVQLGVVGSEESCPARSW